MNPYYQRNGITLYHGDCLEVLPTLQDSSVDCVITDPPYPEISREYGRMSEADWFAMMRVVVPECRRIHTEKGSAVYVLQPNSERVGRMRTWLWEFMAWVGKEFGIVQDAYWWNTSALPQPVGGQLTPAIKPCVWIGGVSCYRYPLGVVRMTETPTQDAPAFSHARGVHSRKRMYEARDRNGGSHPHNCVPIGGRGGGTQGGELGHPAATPINVALWWTRYICPPSGRILDPFAGSGTTGITALRRGCSWVGIEKMEKYCEIAARRLEAEPVTLFDGLQESTERAQEVR